VHTTREGVKHHVLQGVGTQCPRVPPYFNPWVSSVRSASSKYTAYLAQRKEEADSKKEREKRKADDEAVQELENKRKSLKTDVSAVLSSAKEMYAVSQRKLA